jgi:hypothetical protein
MLSAARSALSRSRQARTTVAPCTASTLAVSRPSPELAPVTTTVRPAWPGTSATVQLAPSPRVLNIATPPQDFQRSI